MSLCLHHFTAKDVLVLKISHQNGLVNNVVVTGARRTCKTQRFAKLDVKINPDILLGYQTRLNDIHSNIPSCIMMHLNVF